MTAADEFLLRPIEEEFEDAYLCDLRLSRRLESIGSSLMQHPDAGFPQAFTTEAELEAFYRFLSNEKVTPEAVLAPHVCATVERAKKLGTTLVVHDTTAFTFGGAQAREGLGHTASKAQGFLGHFALAVAFDESRTPLGLLGVTHWVRGPSKASSVKSSAPWKESQRWGEMVDSVEDLCGDSVSCVHVMDREADSFELLKLLDDLSARFVIRAARNRRVQSGEAQRLTELMQHKKHRATRVIEVCSRGEGINPSMTKLNPPRQARSVEVGISGMAVELISPHDGHTLRVNVVRVWELRPFRGQPSVEWLLMTTEPINNADALHRIVDIYRARWVIEEYFKALKTGCAFEKRQLESLHTLINAMAILAPVAWRLLLVRAVAQSAPQYPASELLPASYVQILADKKGVAPKLLTAEQALLAIARLGGHLRRNGSPGWMTLGRGLQQLVLMEVGWAAATRQLWGPNL